MWYIKGGKYIFEKSTAQLKVTVNAWIERKVYGTAREGRLTALINLVRGNPVGQVFSVLDNRLLTDNLSHLPKVAIWIRKGQMYSFPPWWNTKTFETVNSFSWNGIVKCIVFCNIRCGRDYALFLVLNAVMDQIRPFVVKRYMSMSWIRTFLGLFLLRFDSDKWDLTQTWLRYLSKKWRVKPLIRN